MNQHSVWPGVVLVAIGAAAATIMGIAHVEASVIAMVITVLIVPVLAAMISGKQAETAGAVQQVKDQTNGANSRLIDIIERQGAMLAAGTQPPVQPVADPTPPEQDQAAA